jgi:hypothetical protein
MGREPLTGEHGAMSSTVPRHRPLTRAITVGLSVAVLSSLLIADVQAGITRPFSASSTVMLADGIRYQKGTMRTNGGKQTVRVARVDTTNPNVRLRSLLSNDLVVGRERPTALVRRKGTATLRPMVATNGDMSARQRVDAWAAPNSMAVSNGELMVAQACTRPILGIDSTGRARISEVRVHVTLDPRGSPARQVHRVNTHRDDSHVVLYTRRFARRTQTAPGGIEVVLDLPRTLRPSDVQEVRVLRVRRGGGNTELKWGQAVLSVKSSKSDWVRKLRVGQRLDLRTQIVRRVNAPCGGKIARAAGWDDIVEAMGGNHWTSRNGKDASPSYRLYPAGSRRHPRTNVGITADGRVLMVAVDGRQPGYSIGVTLAEAGRLMRSLGAVHSFNLDGGGSTYFGRRRDGQFRVDNRPSDGRERMATQALGVYEVVSGG